MPQILIRKSSSPKGSALVACLSSPKWNRFYFLVADGSLSTWLSLPCDGVSRSTFTLTTCFSMGQPGTSGGTGNAIESGGRWNESRSWTLLTPR